MTATSAVVTTPRFFGLFEVLHELDLPGTQVGDLYEGFHAAFYDQLTGGDDFDIPHYVRAAEEIGGPVLEVACGSGRIAVPLARAGFQTTAVDIAPDMLALLRRRLLAEPRDVALRVRPTLADARELSVDRPHRLAIIGAMSVCLLRDHEDRVAAFRSIRNALEPDGRFLLDFLETSSEALRAQDAEVLAIPARASGGASRFTLLGRRWVPEENVQLVNFATEEVDPVGRTRRYLGSTTKAIVGEDELRAQLERADFEVLSIQTIQVVGEGATAERIRLLTCRPA